jgi:hypothetical protein
MFLATLTLSLFSGSFCFLGSFSFGSSGGGGGAD